MSSSSVWLILCYIQVTSTGQEDLWSLFINVQKAPPKYLPCVWLVFQMVCECKMGCTSFTLFLFLRAAAGRWESRLLLIKPLKQGLRCRLEPAHVCVEKRDRNSVCVEWKVRWDSIAALSALSERQPHVNYPKKWTGAMRNGCWWGSAWARYRRSVCPGVCWKRKSVKRSIWKQEAHVTCGAARQWTRWRGGIRVHVLNHHNHRVCSPQTTI